MSKATDVVHHGRDPRRQEGLVNTPVYRGSTVLFPTVAALEQATRNPNDGVFYGRFGTPTHFALQDAISRLEGAAGTVVAASGLQAITVAALALLRAGDHVLAADCVYDPTRRFCEGVLKRFGVETSYVRPDAGGDIAAEFRPNTRLVILESPGSLTFEFQDIPAVAQAARERGAWVMVDNTWATPLLCNPLALGADVVVHAATKYIAGHADAMLGTISCNARSFEPVRGMAQALGVYASPDDCFLALRGLRTLDVRLKRHEATGLALARWLARQPEVECVLHPAFAEFPGHALWRRDFRGACGLFAAVLKPVPKAALEAMLDGLRLFGMGYSWGGFESLAIPVPAAHLKSARRQWPHEGPLLRFHAGLEDPDELIAELDAGFARLRTASRSLPA